MFDTSLIEDLHRRFIFFSDCSPELLWFVLQGELTGMTLNDRLQLCSIWLFQEQAAIVLKMSNKSISNLSGR